ncbi:MAG: alpha/beta hydrolase [Streptosporangiaceae bacterium]
MDIRSCIVSTADGRTLRVDHADVPAGFPVLVHAGSPGSRRMLGSAVELAATGFGLRLISYDRPGYGDSPAAPGRRVADAAADAAAIAAALGLTRLATWGHSGGGPYALACAGLLPDLVVAGCVFASPAPVDAPGLDFVAGWSDGDREEFELFFRQPELARELRWSRAQQALPALSTAAGWLDLFGAQERTADARTRELASYLALVQQDTLCRGDEGWWEDNVALLSPWGFDPAAISVPVQLWHGERDAAVPPAHGHWLASRIPGADVHLLPGDDHGSIHDDHLVEAYGWLRQVALPGAR